MQYTIVYNIIQYTMRYNTNDIQYTTIYNKVQWTMEYNALQYIYNKRYNEHFYNALTTISLKNFIVYNEYNTLQYSTIL